MRTNQKPSIEELKQRILSVLADGKEWKRADVIHKVIKVIAKSGKRGVSPAHMLKDIQSEVPHAFNFLVGERKILNTRHGHYRLAASKNKKREIKPSSAQRKPGAERAEKVKGKHRTPEQIAQQLKQLLPKDGTFKANPDLRSKLHVSEKQYQAARASRLRQAAFF